jgi:hypothetical protein
VKNVVIGQCKLCLAENGRLLESHLLAAGFYRRILSTQSNPHPLLISAKGMRSSSDQVRDNVLCEDCERLFAKNGEDYALRVAADRRSFKLLDELTRCGLTRGKLEDSRWSEIRSSPKVKRDHLAYFALSVFWRAAIHRWPDPEDSTRTIKIELGQTNTESLRLFLLGEAALPPTANLTFYVLTDRLSQATIYLPGRTSKVGFRWGYGFVACGFMFNLFLGKSVDPTASRVCLIHSPERFIWIRGGEQKTLEAVGHISRQRAAKSFPR